MPNSTFRILPNARVRLLFDAAGTRALEHSAQSKLVPHALMQRAGDAVACLALALAPHALRIAVFCGNGNNGGDGFEAAVGLKQMGREVFIVWRGDAARLPADAHASFERARHAGVPVAGDLPADAKPELAIDALLGAGFSGEPREEIAALIDSVNHLAVPTLAIDLPSGLHGDTGHTPGACVRATHTLSLLTLKPGLFTAQGRDACGQIWLNDLGVAVDESKAVAVLAGPPSPRLGERHHAQHKGSFGDVAVIGGAPGMAGAALLAARAALVAGAGRVYVSMLDDRAPSFDVTHPELMFRSRFWLTEEATLTAARVVCGCGGGDAIREPLPRLLSVSGRLVLDADAINAIARDPVLRQLLKARASKNKPTILTPHPLEAARLLSITAAEVQSHRLRAAQQLAEELRCVVVLKGSGTIVAAPDRRPSINPTGSAALATAGTGDVLAGLIGGCWSEGLDAIEAATDAVWKHGAVATEASQTVVAASQLIERLAC